MPILTVGTTEIPYTLRRSGTAKHARFTVTPDAVELVVPEAATDEQIAGVLSRRRAWLAAEHRKMSEKALLAPRVAHFVSGAKIPYRGRLMRLSVERGSVDAVQVEYRNGFRVICPSSLDPRSADSLIEMALRLLLKKRLREDVAQLVRQHGEPNGLKPRAVHVRELKHMWGSCGTDRSISLNWQLVFAPRTVLEYAVVHELCHLRHRSHEPEFWTLVGQLLPNWTERKVWLERNEHLMNLKSPTQDIKRVLGHLNKWAAAMLQPTEIT